MSFTPAFLDELRGRFRVSDVVGRRVKLIRRGREFVGLCPFHNEKTPSFTVNDDKAFYHCFGCGENGDVITFVMKTENLSFPESIERLAAEAGMAVPQQSPREREEEQKRATLYDVMELAATYFKDALKSDAGMQARAYLDRRGVSAAAVERFGLGFAPSDRRALLDHLTRKQITVAQMIEAGLVIRPEGRDETYDRFRDRIMFPITDGRGRVVAFGGRAMSKDAQAKYLNSPDTPLFHKGRLLYNLRDARAAVRDARRTPLPETLIIAEGYMDVIALSQAGLENAVAPLGTALTEDQLHLLWRVVHEPVLCFDGDEAGLRAAFRAAERALPLLEPGHSLRFALMAKGQDPDDLIREGGRGAMVDVLEAARPLVDMIWARRTGEAQIDTPERRAGLEEQVMALTRSIRNDAVRTHYREQLRARLDRLFGRGAGRADGRGPRGQRSGGFARKPGRYSPRLQPYRDPGASMELKRSRLAGGMQPAWRREAVLVLTVLNHPELLTDFFEDFAAVPVADPELDKLRNEIIDVAASGSDLDSEGLKRHLSERGVTGAITRIDRHEVVLGDWFAEPDAAFNDVVIGFRQALFQQRRPFLEAELKAAQSAFDREQSEENWAALLEIQKELQAVEGNEAVIDGYGEASGRTART